MRKKISYGILFCCLSGALFYMMFQWQELKRFSNQAGLRYESGTLSVQQMEEYETGEQEEPVEITIWKIEKEQPVVWEETGREVRGTVIKVYGNMARVLPFSMKYGSFTFYGDTSGCIISSELAWRLFGAEDVTGNMVSYEGREWQIRGILDMEESVLALYQEEKQEGMPYVEVWTEGEPPGARLEQITSSLGLFGESYVFAGSFYCSVARILISLPFWLVFFYSCKEFIRWGRKTERSHKRWIQAAGAILFLVIFVIGFRCSISFTSDFIPVQWSDFDFWGKKAEEIMEGIRQRNQFPEIYWEKQVIMKVRKIAAGSGVMVAGVWCLKFTIHSPMSFR